MSAAARRLWLVFLMDALLLTVALLLAGASDNETIVRPVRRFLAGEQQTDSWRPMDLAKQYLTHPHERPVYEELLKSRGVKFQYPLSSLLFTRHLSLDTLNVVSWVSIVLVVAVVWLILRRTGTGTPLEFGAGDPTVGLALIGLTLTFSPLMEAYALGQIQAWINAALALATLAWLTRREDLAGVAIGFACLLKPTYLLLGVWGLVRRKTRFVVPMAAMVVLGTLAALVAYGIADNVDYLNALREIGQRGEVFYPNQSFNGLLNRLFENGDSLKFDRYAFAPFHPVVYAGTLAAFLTLIPLALWLPRRSADAGSVTDFWIFLLTITITSPVAWTHHYGAVVVLFAAAAPRLLMTKPFGRATAPVLLLCYVAVSQSLALTNRLAGTGLGVVQSYVFAAAVVLLALMYRSLFVRAQPAAVSGPALLPSTAFVMKSS